MSKVSESSLYNILLGRISTEKVALMEGHSEYGFYVAPEANKIQIKKAVELSFNVKVDRVTTIVSKGKKKVHAKMLGCRKDRKKAFVRLAETQVIDFESL